MRRHIDATPCPAPALSFPINRYAEYGPSTAYAPAAYLLDETTTTTLDYTTEVKVETRHAKPRRPRRDPRKSALNPAIDIFEDVALEEAHQEQATEMNKKSRTSVLPRDCVVKRSTILSHPAQKVPIPASQIHESQHPKPTRRRVSQLLNDRHMVEANTTVQLQEDLLEKKERRKEVPKKDPRRRTIYVPSDDTTVMTIHPGQPTHRTNTARVKEPDFGLELVTVSEDEGKLVPALKQARKAPRKSLAVPPKRGPLQNVQRGQNMSFSEDVVGTGGGKENVPPGMSVADRKAAKGDPEVFLSKSTMAQAPRVHFSTTKPSSGAGQPKTKTKSDETRKRVKSQLSYDGSPAKSLKAKADCNAASAARKSEIPPRKTTVRSQLSKKGSALLSSSPFHNDKTPPTALRRVRREQAMRLRQEQGSSEPTILHIVGKAPSEKEKYPVLTEDLARPELYEDHWLTYQEIAITQLINSFFDSAHSHSSGDMDADELRKRMLALYHDPAVPVLHKRIQASLTYGALSIPKDLLSQALRLKDDVGLRKKFLNLWVRTYDLTCLRAAAEAVVGRQIPISSRLSTGSTASDDGNSRQFRAERRAIESFLDTFLIRNEDAVRVKSSTGTIGSIARGGDQGDDFGSPGWSWRRTALRSLMLVLLLDKAKTENTFPGCLFQASSPHKSSVDILHALANILLPSHGDITRPLSHLNYRVEHLQYPLQEYTYHIDNLATDLRNGVILTRLVELLLYPTASQGDETVTISMPTGEILTSILGFQQDESWALSQHLKFPAIGRPQKVYNVQVVLSALASSTDLPPSVTTVTADDIVDGHREKTLSLLWALVGKWGLGSLVDWTMLAKEVARYRDKWYDTRSEFDGAEFDTEDEEATADLNGMQYHKHMLLSWARSIARFRGLKVANLTTSFANDKVFEALVDAYLPTTLLPSEADSSTLSLPAKLRATGCSTSFIALFADRSTSTIPSRDFTVLSLAFLASRLLPLSLTHRAASTIQRAFRRHLDRRMTSRRIAFMRLAHECKDVALARENLVNAVLVIQSRWRLVLEGRKAQLQSDVEKFQALARGWAIRRWVRRVTGGRVGGKEKTRRIRGGW